MRSFLKIFLASLLAIIVFCIIIFFFIMGMTGKAVSNSQPVIRDKTVLVINLANSYVEQPQKSVQSVLRSEVFDEVPGLYRVLKAIAAAKADSKVRGIYLVAGSNGNGIASSQEIRQALEDFKKSGKFIIAHGDMMSQAAYAVANVANKIYVTPAGNFEWKGYSVNYLFLKGALDKLNIQPQIFYAGKFKSATEPLRTDKMTEANKLQTTVWLNDLYSRFLQNTAAARKLDTATLLQLANAGKIQNPQDALSYKLIDGLLYDDGLQREIKRLVKIPADEKINFLDIAGYAATMKQINKGTETIALVYATGDIVDGNGDETNIGSIRYVQLLRKLRMEKSIKAVVIRVNSGGGSALASDNIWNELRLMKKEKPVIVSFGDVAASGGYYMSCAADSIFALPETITGSIGVFSIIPDISGFLKDKLGVTSDGVYTGPLANFGSMDHPMNDQEKRMMQQMTDRIYTQFKSRVSAGRKKDTAYVETIAQGRVWTGIRAKEIGLIDGWGGMLAAIHAAASKAGLKDYQIKEFPVKSSFVERILGIQPINSSEAIKKELGQEYAIIYKELKNIREMCNSIQARLPFQFLIY